MEEETERYSCLKLLIPSNSEEEEKEEPIFVKGTWFPTHFHLAITDGHSAWYCHASEEDVKQRALQWDQSVSDYLRLCETYLGHQQPHSRYAFDDAGDGHKRLSWTFDKAGLSLSWRWKCLLSLDSKKITAQILDFLLDSNIRLSDEVVRQTDLTEKMKAEAEKCLTQSERIANERVEFESEIYVKFLGVLNSKKSKLRELRDKLSKQENAGKSPEEEDTEKTKSFDEESDNDTSDENPQKDITSSSKDVMAKKPSGRKRSRRT
ncbi:hypothetical protein RJT34_23484 [Clitoria ternatea]|uniref:XRCC4 N-terminal domain-containing protein n=1 Tax=Clitoria ternatea TaxID=43366 RepID=A0AAN9IIH3_CLITE